MINFYLLNLHADEIVEIIQVLILQNLKITCTVFIKKKKKIS